MEDADRVHPGLILKKEVFDTTEMPLGKTAKLLQLSGCFLSQISNGTRDITLETSCRISEVFGGDPEKWFLLQMKYDILSVKEKVKKLNLPKFVP